MHAPEGLARCHTCATRQSGKEPTTVTRGQSPLCHLNRRSRRSPDQGYDRTSKLVVRWEVGRRIAATMIRNMRGTILTVSERFSSLDLAGLKNVDGFWPVAR